MIDRMKLYYTAHTCSLATHIVLEEVGASYETVRIDFRTTQQRSPEYLKINPKGPRARAGHRPRHPH